MNDFEIRDIVPFGVGLGKSKQVVGAGNNLHAREGLFQGGIETTFSADRFCDRYFSSS